VLLDLEVGAAPAGTAARLEVGEAAARAPGGGRGRERERGRSGPMLLIHLVAAAGAARGGRGAARFGLGNDRAGMRRQSETFSLTRRWHTLRNYKLLRVLLFRESPEEVLRILYINFAQLLGSSFAELKCSALDEGLTRQMS
jgi:hypothetical protein